MASSQEFTDETYATLKSLWDRASAVVAWNALFDMGALSVAYPQNTFDANKEAPEPKPGQKSPGSKMVVNVVRALLSREKGWWAS